MSFARAQLRRIVAALLVLAAIGLAAAGGADARPPPDKSVLVAESGRTLLDRDGDLAVHPASLTKMMTLYLLFDALDSGRLKLDSPIRFSRKAARQPPSKLGTPAGGAITVRTAILALAVKSGNDVAVAVAERLAGSEQKFALQMNEKARALGMSRTNFVNASGLHDRDQVSTLRDLARLARGVLYKHKTYFDRFSAS
ncbi:MAG: serine hydrolase, partial [Alphaproteobacteria bacterium]